MPELFDMPQKEMFSFPGCIDRAKPMPTIQPVVAVEATPTTRLKSESKQLKELTTPNEKPKRERKKKAVEETSAPNGMKKLKISKPKF